MNTPPTIVILTALPLEYEAVVAYLPQRRKEIKSDNTIYEIGEYVTPKAPWQVVVGKLAAQGNYQAARETEWAIGHFAPTYMFFVGIAGGLKDVQLGDVVAASFVRGYEGGKTEDDKWKPRVSVEHPSHALLQLAQNLAGESQWLKKLFTPAQPAPKAWVCPIASGEKVVASRAFLAQLQETCGDAVAVEMEALGFLGTFRAKPQVQGIVIRGISDLVVDKSKTDAKGWQPIAARNAAAFAFAMLDELGAVSPLLTKEGPGVVSPIFRLPLPHNEYFTGRADILTQIHDTLPQRPVAVCGLGGLGKTQVAVEYAYQHQGEYTYVFWLSANDNVTLQTGVEAIAKDLGLHQPLRPDEVRAWVKEKFSHTPNWLLVVDNADELEQIQQVFKELLPLPLTTGQVLLTTRQQSPPPPLTPLTLDTLTDDQGAELLLRRTHNLESKSSDLDHARTLSHTLQGLPLALAQAAAYLYQRGCGYQKYLTLYQQNAARLLKERGKLIFDQDHPLPVATTWQVSLTQIQQQQPRALELLHYCAFLSSAGIPEEVLLKVLDIEEFDLEDWLDPILSYSLLTRDSDSQQVRIHSLVQTILRSELGEEKGRALVEQLVGVVVNLFPTSPDVKNWPQLERLVPSALACAEGIQCYQIETEIASRLLLVTAIYLQQRRADYVTALPLFQHILEIDERVLGRNHPDTAMTLNFMVGAYSVTGQYKRALPLSQRALEITERVLGENHPQMVESLNYQASLYHSTGQYGQALPLYQWALEISERVLGTDPLLTATSLNSLALLYYSTGQYEQALPLYQRALEINERVLGTDHSSTAMILNNLAELYRATSQYERALQLFQRALEIHERVLGKDHPNTATILNNLALLYQATGQYEQALPLYESALEIRERVLGKDHPNTATSLNNLAGLYQATGQYKQALPLYQRTLDIRERVLGTDHPDTATSLWWLAVFYGSQGEYEKALSFYERALPIFQKKLGEQHPDTRACTENYQELLRQMASQGGAGKESWWQKVKRWMRWVG